MIREANIFIKDHSKVGIKAVLVYPSTYRVAVSTLSYHMLYFLVNSFEDVALEHTAYEFKDYRGVYSLESNQPISKFDLIFYSVHYELDYSRIISSLLESGVQPLRRRREGRPIIVVGGPPVYSNPSTLSEIADVIVVGELEGPVPEIVRTAVEFGVDEKDEFLEELGSVEGLYIPSNEIFTGRFYVKDSRLEGSFQPIEQIQPLDEDFQPVFGRSFLEETSRGCPFPCRFCLVGYRFNPPRHKSGSRILREVRAGLKANRVSKVSLIASSYFSNPDAKRVLEEILKLNVEASIPSLRIETLDLDSLELIARLGQKTLTIAPEAGSYSLRLKLGKPLLDDLILEVACKAKSVGIKNLKLYFMYGIEGESIEDLKSIGLLIDEIASKCGFKKFRELRASINPFIPKPGTPLQWLKFESLDRLLKKWKYIREDLRKRGVRVEGLNPKLAEIQAVLSLGGPEITGLMVEWSTLGGSLPAWKKVKSMYGNVISKALNPKIDFYEVPWSKFYSRDVMETLKVEYENYLESRGVIGDRVLKVKRGV